MSGPLTRDDFLALWKSSVDPTYSEPLVEAGEGNGFEAYTQVFEQFARVSRAIDTSMQALFIKPWSGQTDLPAQGARKARVTLTFSRTLAFDRLVVLDVGTLVSEVASDWGDEGPTPVETGRRYVLVEPLVFMPGEAGPLTVVAEAERPGWGYNNPLLGTLKLVVQKGQGSNDLAAITRFDAPLGASPPISSFEIVCEDQPPTFLPANVGCYVRTVPSRSGRILSFRNPNPPTDGGAVKVALDYAIVATVFNGAFRVGEIADLLSGLDVIGTVKLLAFRVDVDGRARIAFQLLDGTATGMDGLISRDPGINATFDQTMAEPTFLPAGSVTWTILDWVSDFGVVVTNVASPLGGILGYLDELGAERAIYRAPGESDDLYRERIFQARDVVTPMAVQRAANRVLLPLATTACLREVGSARLPGAYFDLDAFDYDFDVRPEDRFKLMLDFAEMRGFFLVGVPCTNIEDFGLFFDGSTSDLFPLTNAFDLTGPVGFFDGYPVGSAALYRSIWQAINTIKAGGVGFDLYVEDIGCTP